MTAKLTVLGSSSQGNGYLLECGEDKLILECGVPAKEVLKLINWESKSVGAVLCSHRVAIQITPNSSNNTNYSE